MPGLGHFRRRIVSLVSKRVKHTKSAQRILTTISGAEGFLKAANATFFYPESMKPDPWIPEQQGDAQAQKHPEGNVPGRIESPEVGLPVDDGQPSGEKNGEEQDEREED